MNSNRNRLPTLTEAARRNPSVEPTKVAKYLEVVRNLQSHGVIESPKYAIQHPLARNGSIGQSTQSIAQQHHQ